MPLVSRLEQQLSTSSDVALIRPISVAELELSRRQITGQRTFFFFGFNNDIGAGWEDINSQGADYTWLESGVYLGVSSSDAADTSAGLGVQQVELHGLSTTGEDQDEVITMDGTTEVQSSLIYRRVNKLHSENVGTYGGSHKGDVTLRVDSGGAKTGSILALMIGIEGSVDTSVQYGLGEAGAGHYSIPLGKVAYLIGGEVYVNTTGVKTADIVLYERDGLLTDAAPFEARRVLWDAVEVQGTIPITFKSFIKIKALSDIWFRAQASTGGTKIQVQLEFFLVDANAEGE